MAAEYPVAPARERRLHARAFAAWSAMPRTGALPRLTAFDPHALPEAAAQSFLIALGDARRPPRLHFIGRALAEEAGVGEREIDPMRLPRASLLFQLMRQLPRVADRAAPLAFDYDGPGAGDAPTHHRGILLPYADARGKVAYVQGVVGWRRIAGAALDAGTAAVIETSLALEPAPPAPCPWGIAAAPAAPPLSLDQRLATARMRAALADADRPRRAAHLAAALSAAHDLLLAADADPDAFAALGESAGDALVQAVRLTFGFTLPRLTEARHRATLAHARRLGLGSGMLLPLIERHPGGAAALARAEARARRGRPAAPERGAAGRMRLDPIDGAYLLGVAARDGVASPLRGHVAR